MALPLQTTYAARILPAVEGMIVDMRDQVVVSKNVETAAGIGFGKVACRGTTEEQILVATAGRPFMGITVMSHFASAGLADLYAQYETANVLAIGAIWVMASVTVAPGDLAYFVPATGVLTNVVGANTIIPGATFETATTGAALAVLWIR